ncbi:hypothetical protein VNO77_19517 [Canavalia gladiata]|uniref:Bromo domain-containing protein n=1 Tax=Canavalia gladiata TaxID=3824 RepID=A0AAN9QPP5_CANGL
MAEKTEPSQRKFIIKLHLPRSDKKRGPPCEEVHHSPDAKRRKVSSSSTHEYGTTCNNTSHSYSAEVEENLRGVAKDSSRTVSKEQEHNNKKKVSDSCDVRTKKVASDEVSAVTIFALKSTTTPSKGGMKYPIGKENSSRISKTWSEEECKLKNNIEKGVHEVCNNKKNEKEKHIVIMDRCKKMQCWVMLKRLMVGRDRWAFKQPLLDDPNCKLKPIGLKDIESKLNKWVYLEPDEFANDIRLVFSYALQYPPRSEVHRVASRLGESFELNWKTLKKKWILEDKQKRKFYEREQVCPKDDHGKVHEKEITTRKEHNMPISDSHLSQEKKGMPKGRYVHQRYGGHSF